MMETFKVQLREVIFTDIEVKAESLEEAKQLVKQAREEAGKQINSMTDELEATIYHSNGYEKISLIK